MDKEMRIYNMDKALYEIKRDLTISKYSKKIECFSKEKVSNKQKDFASVVTDNLLHTYDNKIEITTARCGMGKSELIKSFLYNLVNDAMVMGMPNYTSEPHPFGVIVVTDKLERLEKIMQYKGLENRCYFMKWDNKDTATQERKEFKDQLKEQYKYPILQWLSIKPTDFSCGI